jgi:phenylalanyl-tRNA synthetase beta chain
MVAWLYATPHLDEPAWRDTGFLRFKGECEAIVRAICGSAPSAVSTTAAGLHPGKSAALLVDGRDVATVGALDPRLRAGYELDADVYVALVRLSDVPKYAIPRYVAPSKYPPIARDLALVVGPDVPAIDIEHAVRAGADGVLASVRVFDEYRGPQVEAGKKSLAVRFVLQRRDATLTDAEAEEYTTAIVASLRERVGAIVRG